MGANMKGQGLGLQEESSSKKGDVPGRWGASACVTQGCVHRQVHAACHANSALWVLLTLWDGRPLIAVKAARALLARLSVFQPSITRPRADRTRLRPRLMAVAVGARPAQFACCGASVALERPRPALGAPFSARLARKGVHLAIDARDGVTHARILVGLAGCASNACACIDRTWNWIVGAGRTIRHFIERCTNIGAVPPNAA